MGRGALSCCATEPLLNDAAVVKSAKGSSSASKALDGKKPPTPISTGQEPVAARDKSGGSGRAKSPAPGSPATPLKKAGSRRMSEKAPAPGQPPPLPQAKPPETAATGATEAAAAATPAAGPSQAEVPQVASSSVAADKQNAAPAGIMKREAQPSADAEPVANPPEPDSPSSPTGGSVKSERPKRRRSQSDTPKGSSAKPPTGPVAPPCLGGTWSEPKLVRAPVAGEDIRGEPSINGDDFVMLRPLPYEPIPWDRGDNNRIRTFVYKGSLVQVPLMPLGDLENGSHKPAGKKEDAGRNKGWKVVKSKVVGGAMKG